MACGLEWSRFLLGVDLLRLTPFLLFDGNCAAAMAFYSACFGGELAVTRLGETPMKEGFPAGQHGKVVNAYLKSDAIEFSATDWLHPTQVPRQGNTVAMYITAVQEDELRGIFDKLREGADPETLVELCEMPFGLYGRLTDRFGVGWFFRGERVSQ
jgi:PhnB protein